MAFHRILRITGLALYEALLPELRNQDEVIQRIHELLWHGPMSKMIGGVAFFVRRSEDPFQRFLQVLGPKNEWFFPCPPWEKEPVQIQDGVGWHQKRCPYAEFFDREGIPELTRAYCDMDLRMAELLPAHVELQREHALCRGDDHCDFLFDRKQLARTSAPS